MIKGVVFTQIMGIFNNKEALNVIISATVFAAIISSIINFIANLLIAHFSKKREYKNKFYELVLNKRISAYESLISVINQLYAVNYTVRENDNMTLSIHSDLDSLIEFKNELDNNKNIKFWISMNTSMCTQELGIYLHNTITVIQKTDEHLRDKVLKEIAEQDFQKIRELRDKINSSLSKDFANLYDIDSFLKKYNKKFDYSNKAFEKYIEYSPTTNE